MARELPALLGPQLHTSKCVLNKIHLWAQTEIIRSANQFLDGVYLIDEGTLKGADELD